MPSGSGARRAHALIMAGFLRPADGLVWCYLVPAGAENFAIMTALGRDRTIRHTAAYEWAGSFRSRAEYTGDVPQPAVDHAEYADSHRGRKQQRYRYLLSQGTTGLSVAFDLPTQMGYDADHP